ncbi:RNA-binding protein, CCR4-NOT complex subunit Rcd1 [Diaporthe australafricana]|uniref:RNA-binding protein, CCR4-NOT complex subunit Rcd1 n=1 Tax=Diaporthe australafricana TaxID=127596 RepID=A0ABR3X6Z9_9PEZI
MMPNHPMYPHQHFPQDTHWMHPAQSHHQQQQQQQQAQAQHHAASALAQQQAHYNRINSSSNHTNALNPVHQEAAADNPNMSEDNRRTMQYIADLLNENSREQALLELSKKREQVPELALILWHSFGVMTSLVQEIISVYTLLNPSQLTAAASNRVCNALALLQCVASHNETRTLFLNAHIPLYLYPFLNTTSKSRPFEYLRLTSLGVIGALVKNDSSEVINFLLTTEIIPLCLRIMETGSELSKTVAIFIVQKILLDDNGLNYICATYERFYAVGTVLSNMVGQLVEQQTARLLKHVVRCFLRLSDNARAREALRQCLPEPLRDATFSSVLRDDAATKRCLTQLLVALSDNAMPDNAAYHSLPVLPQSKSRFQSFLKEREKMRNADCKPEEDSQPKEDVELERKPQAKESRVEEELEAEVEPAICTGANAIDDTDNGLINDNRRNIGIDRKEGPERRAWYARHWQL